MFRLLGIGNSFSDDSFEFIRSILTSLGEKDVKIENLFIPGCSIDKHVENIKLDLPCYELRRWQDKFTNSLNYKLKDALLSDEWDYISLQQYSGESGLTESYKNLPFLIDYVKKNKPNSKFIWNMTWAYKNTSFNPGFKYYNNNQTIMYNSIVKTVQEIIVPNTDFCKIIPVGTAIQNARTSVIGDNLTRDTTHLSFDFGRYIAGLTFVCSILNISPSKVKYVPDGVDEYRKKIADLSVENAIKNPFTITNFNKNV